MPQNDRVLVQHGEVQSRSAKLSSGAGQLETQISELSGQIESLRPSFVGASAESFQALYAEWRQHALGMQRALGAIGTQLKATGVRFADEDARGAADFARLGR